MENDGSGERKGFGLSVLACVMLVGMVANAFSNTLPVLLTSLGRTRGLTEVEGGLFTLAELGGLAVGVFLCASLPGLVERLNWRRTAILGLLLIALANLLMIPPVGFAYLFIFGIPAGIGAGLVNAVLYAVLAEGDGARALGAFNTLQLAFAAAGMLLMSYLATRFGGGGLFAALSIMTLLVLPLCRFFPKGRLHRPAEAGSAVADTRRISPAGWAVVVGMALYFTATGATFGFIAYMGIAWGGSREMVEGTVSIMMIVSMAATIFATLLGSRFGYVWPLAVGATGVVFALLLFVLVMPVQTFLLLGCIFYFSANLVVPYLFDALTDVDSSSSAAMMLGGTQLGGIAIGPAIAGFLVTPDYRVVNGLAFLLSATALFWIFFVIWRHRRVPVDQAPMLRVPH